jgi:hypothetical protein
MRNSSAHAAAFPATDMYPVIEVDAGRKVDFIVQKGAPLDGKG